MPKFRLFHALCAAMLLPAGPAAAEVTGTGPNGFVSRHEAVVEGSPRDVWLALITPSGWWASEHTWSGDSTNLTLMPQAGGCFCEKIPETEEAGRFTLEGSVEHMRVVHAYPERALRMQGALGPLQSEPVTGILTIAISEVEGGTRIVWEYNVGGTMRYEVPVIARAVDGVMEIQLTALAKLLGPVEVPPQPQTAPEADRGEATEPEDDDASATESVPLPETDEPQIKAPSVSDVFGDLADEESF
ncbi:SRPBCC family protein [Erythrobacter sp.]|uniref:SRPBCC family protein n=1 Tax=Erythrobacter sp. TaxID=1042 RepID=UPI0025D8A162|nr:SRPBCC family protein [Erythrobacter sp.]